MKIESVKENVNFKRAYYQGKSAVTKWMVIYWRKNKPGKKRLGITVSKKLGNSPQRNRVRRIIREGVRRQLHRLPEGCDFIIVARTASLNAKSTEIETVLKDVFSA